MISLIWVSFFSEIEKHVFNFCTFNMNCVAFPMFKFSCVFCFLSICLQIWKRNYVCPYMIMFNMFCIFLHHDIFAYVCLWHIFSISLASSWHHQTFFKRHPSRGLISKPQLRQTIRVVVIENKIRDQVWFTCHCRPL